MAIMSNNPVLSTVLVILADAPSLMGNALSITWDSTKSQESYVSRGPSWQGSNTPAQEVFGKASRLQLLELSPDLSHEFQVALQKRMQASLGLAGGNSAAMPRLESQELDVNFHLSGNDEMVRKVRIGRIVSVLEATCAHELELMVGLQIECLRFFKARSNPFAAEHFASALLHAVEVAMPDELKQQAVLQVLVPSFSQALKAALRQYAKVMTRKLQALAPVWIQDGPWRDARRDEQFEPTVPAGL